MKIIIVGCGKVGYTLAEQLSNENHDLVVIDEKPDRVSVIANDFDALGIVGNGVSFETLNKADIANTDLLIAVTGSDEHNLLCSIIAKKAGNCKTIARVRNPIYSNEISYLRDEFGLAMIINPEFISASEIARIIRFPFALQIDTFAKGRVDLVHFRVKPDSKIVGCTLHELKGKLDVGMLVCLAKRNGEIIIPNGDFTIEENDVLAVVAETEKVNTYFKKLSISSNRVKDVMILGGGMTSYYLAKKLIASDIHVKIIEINYARCEELSELLPEATIINGDVTNQDLLLEEGLSSTGAVISLTGMDEENVLLSLFSKEFSDAKTVTKINHINFSNIIEKLNLDSIIYPKSITADFIIKYARSMNNALNSDVETLYMLEDGEAEALEFFVREESEVVGIPLQTLKLKKNLIICCIKRDKQIIIPSGNDCIQKGDSVMIVNKNYKLCNINDILE